MDQKVKESVDNGLQNRHHHHHPVVAWPPGTDEGSLSSNESIIVGDLIYYNTTDASLPSFQKLRGGGGATHLHDQSSFSEDEEALGSPVSYNKWKKHLGYNSSANMNVSTNINDVPPDESSMHSEDYNPFHRVKLLCSYGGKIMPRPTDKELRYVGGDTRLITVSRDIHFHELMQKMAELYALPCTIKYKLPEEDLDALVSVSSNEDVANMMEEYDRLQSSSASPRLRLFLFSDMDHEPVQQHPNESSSFGDHHRSSTEQQRYVYAVNGIAESGSKRDGGSLAIAPVVIENDVVGEPWVGLIRQQDTIPMAMLAPQISQDVASLIHHVPVALPVSSIPPPTSAPLSSAPSSPPLIPRVMKQGDGDSLHQERDDVRRLPDEVRMPRVLSHGRLLDHHSEASAPLVRQRHAYQQQPQPSQQHGGWQPNLYEEQTHVSLQLPHIRSPFLNVSAAPIFDQPVYNRPVDHLGGEEVFAPFMQRSISVVNTMPSALGSTAVTSFNAAAVSAPSSPRTNPKRDPLLSIGQSHLQQQVLRSHAAAPNYTDGLRHHAARGPVTSPPRYRDHLGQTDERLLLRPLQQQPVLATTDGLQSELFLYDGHRSAYGQYSEGAGAKVSLPGYNPFQENPSSFSEPNPSETQDFGDGRRYRENVSQKLFHPLHFNAQDDDLQDDPRSIQARYQEKPMNRGIHQLGHHQHEEVDEDDGVADVDAAGGRFQIHLPEDSEDLLVVSDSYRNTDMGEPTNNQQYWSTGMQSHVMSLYPSTHGQASVVDMPQVSSYVGLEGGFLVEPAPRSVKGSILELGSTPALVEVSHLPSEILSNKSLTSLTNMDDDKAAIGSLNNFVPRLSSASSTRVGNNTESVVNIAEMRWGENNDVIESRINLQGDSSTILDQFQRLSGSGVVAQGRSSVGTRIEASEELAFQQRSHDNTTIIPDDSMVEEKKNSVAYDLRHPVSSDGMTPIIPQLSISEGQAQQQPLQQPMSQINLIHAPTFSAPNWESVQNPPITITEIDDAQTHTLNVTAKSEEFGVQPPIEVEEKLRSIEDVVPEALVPVHDDKEQSSSNPGTAADAEAEAIRSGLQTIMNADLEEMRELGSGTFGTVYHGKWRGTDVAIKRIKSSCFAGRPAERDRLIADFWREACTLSQLHHPNVVAFYGVVRDSPGGKLATVTEFMVNGSLKQVLQKKDRTIDRRKRLLIAMDAAFGMEYLHSKNIVHFDLKCDNLLVNMRDSHRPICKVGDLGLSKVKHQTMVSGGVRGTLPWMAPELLNGSSTLVTEKVDVFSFGIVMWELLTGEEPYASMHYGAIIGGIVNNTLRPSIPSWCDPLWKSLMEKCWSAEPSSRPSFPEVASELRVMATALQPKAHGAQ